MNKKQNVQKITIQYFKVQREISGRTVMAQRKCNYIAVREMSLCIGREYWGEN